MGAAVIGVGIDRIDAGRDKPKLAGDVNFAGSREKTGRHHADPRPPPRVTWTPWQKESVR